MSRAGPDAGLCPLCGGPNQCGVLAARCSGAVACSDCWCFSARVPAAVLARLPDQARGLACVCPACAGQALPDDRAAVTG